MLTIAPQDVTPTILTLFDLTKPTMPRALNVLEGLNRGHILVDDLEQARWGVVRDAIYGTLYFGGDISASLLEALVQHFREIGEVGIGCWPNDPLNEMLPPNPHYDGRTLYFTERAPGEYKHRVQLPNGFRMLPRTEQLLPLSFDYRSTIEAFGTVEQVIQHTLGVLILDGDQLVCEAATGAPTHGLIEVGITTAEIYRGRGFATIACTQLIEMCEARSYKTWWDCARQNIASINLARKLGYCNEREYRYVWWPRA